MIARLTASGPAVRIVPFAVFIALTACQGWFGEAGRYWFYGAKTLVGGYVIWSLRRYIGELKWNLTWEALLVGVLVFVMWVGIDPYYPPLDELLRKLGLAGKTPPHPASAWNPHAQFGAGSGLAWFFIVVRIAGSSVVVPPIEEVFWRSFIYRYLVQKDFAAVPLHRFALGPFLLTALLFGLEHQQWLAGILCGFAYQGLVIWKGRLGDAVSAHALTNLLLGLWVVGRGAWQFW